MEADRVLGMSNGLVVESGSPVELLMKEDEEKKGEFQKLTGDHQEQLLLLRLFQLPPFNCDYCCKNRTTASERQTKAKTAKYTLQVEMFLTDLHLLQRNTRNT